jgi:hypothetical protein
LLVPLPLIPTELNLVATTEDDIDAETDMGVYQGQTYVLAIQVLDDVGDPFDLGATVAPEWDFDAQLRSDFLSQDSTVDATFTASVVDGPNGRVEFSLTPTQTAALEGEGGRWDAFITNKAVGGNSNYAAGFSQMIFRGKWLLQERVTEA